MRYIGVCLGIMGLVVVLSGCPYDAKVQLGAPYKHTLDSSLIGYWVWDDPDGSEESSLIEVLPFNEAEYLVEVFGPNNKRERFRAFQVQVGDHLFWNISTIDLSSRPKSYSFARSRFTDDGHLSLLFVGEKGVPKGLNSDAHGLVEYIKSHLADPSLDDEDGAYEWRRPTQGEVKEGRLPSWGE